MRPESMDAVFAALGHADRRRILDILKDRPGCTVGDVCAHFVTSRIAVMKHLRVLEAANLIASKKVGRTRRLWINAVPIQMIQDRWISEFSALWATRMTQVKYAVESQRPARCKGTRKKPRRAAAKRSAARSRRRVKKDD